MLAGRSRLRGARIWDAKSEVTQTQSRSMGETEEGGTWLLRDCG